MRQRVPGVSGACATGKRFVHGLGAAVALFGLLCTTACGGGLPLLHPAQTLPAGEVRAAGGFSANIATGPLSTALNAARDAPAAARASGAPPPAQSTKGALVAASVATGLAPVVAVRVGFGSAVEGGVAYTGRGIRADVRKSFDLGPHWAVSVGGGGSAAVYNRRDGGDPPGVDLAAVRGWGADIPVLVGYASDGELYMMWLGVRAGWEHVDAGNASAGPATPASHDAPLSLAATRFWGGGLLGLAVGFRHVHVAMELDASYASVAGDFAGAHASLRGVTLAPATALWWRF